MIPDAQPIDWLTQAALAAVGLLVVVGLIVLAVGLFQARSLVRREQQPGREPRFRMLDAVHEYALEQLEEQGGAVVMLNTAFEREQRPATSPARNASR